MTLENIYSYILKSVSNEMKTLNENQVQTILEEFGISYIFALNENETSNTIQKFKKPIANILSKVKSKFGKQPCTFLSDVIKKAQAKGTKTLIGILTLITLLSSASPAFGKVTDGFDDSLANCQITAVKSWADANGMKRGQDDAKLKSIIDDESAYFITALTKLGDDQSAIYAACGVGCSEMSLEDAKQKAIDDATNTLKQKYGEDVIQKYGIQFKTIEDRGTQKHAITGAEISSFYTVIVAAYQAK